MRGILTTGCEPPIPWIGGKTILLPVIKRIIPERKNKFLDVFGGGGSVSLSGKYAPLQIYNDYNPHLANFMRILKSRSEELIDKLTGAYNSDGTLNENFERTFFINSRDSFNACSNVFHKGDTWEKLFDANLKIQLKAASLAEKEHAWSIVLDAWRLYKERENDPELIDAVLFFYLMKCSYSATGTSWACKAVNRESMVRLINEASRMMQGITVENKDCIELIKLHDDPSTFVYCDPPYYMAEALYNGVPLFGDAKHIELHDTLLECKSDVLLSYNECPFIDELYSESKWYKMRLSRPHSMVLHRGSGAVYNEFLIANYDIYKLYNGDGQLTFLELFDDLNEEAENNLMKKVISTQAIMANGKTTYTGLFTSEGIPAEVELVCVNGNACLSVTIPEDDEEEYVGRPLTEDEIEAICRNYGNCDDCPLYNYCDEEMM